MSFGTLTYRIAEHQSLRQAHANVKTGQSLDCLSYTQNMDEDEYTDEFLSLIVFFANSADPDEMQHIIWVFTV